MMNKQDEQIKELTQLIEAKKLEITKPERLWITKGIFRYGKASDGELNIKTTADIHSLITALAILISREATFRAACKALEIDVEFEWYGHNIETWKSDFKTSIAKIKATTDKVELERMEKTLDELTSEEAKKQNKLDKIAEKLA